MESVLYCMVYAWCWCKPGTDPIRDKLDTKKRGDEEQSFGHVPNVLKLLIDMRCCKPAARSSRWTATKFKMYPFSAPACAPLARSAAAAAPPAAALPSPLPSHPPRCRMRRPQSGTCPKMPVTTNLVCNKMLPHLPCSPASKLPCHMLCHVQDRNACRVQRCTKQNISISYDVKGCHCRPERYPTVPGRSKPTFLNTSASFTCLRPPKTTHITTESRTTTATM